MRRAAVLVLMTLCALPAVGLELRRATIWDLVLGAPVSAQPAPQQFQAFACGSNGGAPRAQLTGWADFKRCPAEADGLHEVYFEYDDEIEYIARAHDNDREISRWAGTHEVTFPVIASALFDDAGILQGVRLVTDPRPDHRNDPAGAARRGRAQPRAARDGADRDARAGLDLACRTPRSMLVCVAGLRPFQGRPHHAAHRLPRSRRPAP